jgi:ribosomal protein L32
MIDDFLDSFFVDHRIASVSRIADSANQKHSENTSKVHELEKRVDKLSMICEALWTVVKKSHKLEDADLQKLVESIDGADGMVNGRKTKSPPTSCPKCGKTVQRGHGKCMYCGCEIERDMFE